MLSLRRRATSLSIVVCIGILLTFFRKPIVTSARSHGVPIGKPLLESLRDPLTGRLRWELVPSRYPPKTITLLPDSTPLQLARVQHVFPPESSSFAETREFRQQAVRTAFVRCWNAYREHAWMSDEVTPLSGASRNTFGGWAATLVDSLDTLWIMGMKSEFSEATTAATTIDLGTSTDSEINVFETTIRHLGGLLSAYDLSGDTRLLQKAKEFGDMLIVAFDTPNRLPKTRWRPYASLEGVQLADPAVLIAEIGSLSLEFTRLSQLTGDSKWYDAVDRIVRLLDEQQFESYLPGMWPVTINARAGNFTYDSLFTLGAMSDSLYEYFPKMHALLGGIDPVYRKLYEGSMATAIEHNLWRPMTPDDADILIAGQIRKMSHNSPAHLIPQGQHLACFAGGMFALGSKLFQLPTHLAVAKKLVDGCIWTYQALPLGIMPEVFRMTACESKAECPWNETRWKENAAKQYPDLSVEEVIEKQRLPKGFTQLSDRRYLLRPEAIESVFLLYRITGEAYLLDAAWEMFTAIMNATQTPLANSALEDVSQHSEESIQTDSMESFWMAETLKYFYLIFSEPELISLDEFVFNTEAHPLKRRLPT